MFKRNNCGKGSPTEEASPIDEDEQAKIAEEIKKQADSQSVSTRSIFRYLFVAIVVIHIVCLVYTVFSPYEMQHQKHFKDLIPLYGFFSSYCGSIYCYTISSLIVQVCNIWFHVLTKFSHLTVILCYCMWFHRVQSSGCIRFYWMERISLQRLR